MNRENRRKELHWKPKSLRHIKEIIKCKSRECYRDRRWNSDNGMGAIQFEK